MSSIRKHLFLCLLLTNFSAVYNAQVFQQTQDDYTIDHSYLGGYLGGGVSTYDFNSDGLDDISLPSGNGGTKFYLNTGSGFQEQFYLNLSAAVRSIIWVDYDNDGDNDISLTEQDGLFRLFKNDGSFLFTEVDLGINDNTPTFNSGISWGDYDNDGLLDAYVTRYPFISLDSIEEKTNLLIKNQGGDYFVDMTETLNIGNGFQHSFISTWLDIDGDNDLDLYVVNDRFEFPNATFLNNADGTFTEVTNTNGADLAVLAMTSTIDDYDNDQDLDIYCTNTFLGNHLLVNNGNGLFINQFPMTGAELFRFSWGANWIDFQNDGWKDLFVSVGEFNSNNVNAFFTNDHNGGFSDMSSFLLDTESNDSHGCSKGDFNNDGLYDLAVNNEAPFNSRVLLNGSGTQNNFVKVTLQGTFSNSNAIGSKIYAFVNGQTQMYFTACGSNYISQDSQNTIIGIGQNEILDSLAIKWPSGLYETFYDLQASSSVLLVEGAELSTSIYYEEDLNICSGESIELSVSAEVDSILWSNGSNELILEAEEPGIYWAHAFIGSGVIFTTDTVTITPDISPFEIENSTSDITCFGNANGTAYFEFTSELSDDTLTYFIDSLSSGNYNHFISFDSLCNANVEYTIQEPAPLFTQLTPLSLPCSAEDIISAEAITFGGTGPYFYSALDSLTVGNNSITTTDSNGCELMNDFFLDLAPDILVELNANPQIEEMMGSLTIISLNSQELQYIIYNAEMIPCSPESLIAGDYSAIIWNEYECEIQVFFTIDFLNGINNIQEHEEFELFPNPSSTNIYITNCQHIKNATIISNVGEIIYQNMPLLDNCSLDISKLKKGVYYIKITSQDYQCSFKKLIKN